MPEKETTNNELRQASRENLLEVWKKYKQGLTEDLGAEELLFAKLMKEHESEFDSLLNEDDGVENKEFTPGKEKNPFLHISLHALVENQLNAKQPIETVQFYNAMKKKNVSHHNIQHLLMAMVFPLILESSEKGKPFDNERYKSLLKKLKSKKPEKIQAAINMELPIVVA